MAAHRENTLTERMRQAILVTGVIEAKQHRDIMANDVPNTFVQTPIPQDGEKVIMKMWDQLHV